MGHWQQTVHGVFEGSSTDLIHDRANSLVQRHAILIVRIEAMQTCDNHELKADKDDVWYMLKGEGVHVVGRRGHCADHLVWRYRSLLPDIH